MWEDMSVDKVPLRETWEPGLGSSITHTKNGKQRDKMSTEEVETIKSLKLTGQSET